MTPTSCACAPISPTRFNPQPQGRIAAEGLAYLELGFPRLDYITGCDLTWQSDELPPR